jgi:NADPH:quinone reductase
VCHGIAFFGETYLFAAKKYTIPVRVIPGSWISEQRFYELLIASSDHRWDERTMKAVLATELGPVQNYRLGEMPIPACGPTQVRIRISAVALGFADGLLCQGLYQVKPALPFIPGCEFAGVVDAVGNEVRGIAPGRTVVAQGMGGGMAEYVAVDAGAIFPLPEGLDAHLACAFWVDFSTAYYALANRGNLKPGETVLVLGAAGSLGLAAVQVAKALGAVVIAAASTPGKREAAVGAGADKTIDYTAADWGDQLKALTAGKGVDIVFDPVGGDSTETAFRRLAWGGRHLVLGFTGGYIPKLPANLPLLKGAALVGVDIRQFSTVFEADAAAAERGKISELAGRGLLRPVVGATYKLADFERALEACTDRNRIGKVVVTV